MEISYTAPLRRAWSRMRAMLFRPFGLDRWLVVGFSAFLADLLSSGGGMFGWKNSVLSHRDSAVSRRVFEGAREQAVEVLTRPAVLFAIAAVLVVAGIVLLVLTWVSARARFVFLENVATGRGEFSAPWRRFGRLGNSLFLWYAAFSFAWLVPLAAGVLPFGPTILHAVRGLEPVGPDWILAGMGLVVAVTLAFVLGFVSFLTRAFVVPLMLLHDEGAARAWRRFWPLLQAHPGTFIAYGLFVLVAWFAVSVAVIFTGFATCCVGFLLLMIPFVGTVVMLPILVTARAYAPEFLAQFGPEWDLFASRAPRAEEPPAPLLG